jgi:hypothetical protein
MSPSRGNSHATASTAKGLSLYFTGDSQKDALDRDHFVFWTVFNFLWTILRTSTLSPKTTWSLLYEIKWSYVHEWNHPTLYPKWSLLLESKKERIPSASPTVGRMRLLFSSSSIQCTHSITCTFRPIISHRPSVNDTQSERGILLMTIIPLWSDLERYVTFLGRTNTKIQCIWRSALSPSRFIYPGLVSLTLYLLKSVK